MSVDLPSSTLPQVLKRNNSIGWLAWDILKNLNGETELPLPKQVNAQGTGQPNNEFRLVKISRFSF